MYAWNCPAWFSGENSKSNKKVIQTWANAEVMGAILCSKTLKQIEVISLCFTAPIQCLLVLPAQWSAVLEERTLEDNRDKICGVCCWSAVWRQAEALPRAALPSQSLPVLAYGLYCWQSLPSTGQFRIRPSCHCCAGSDSILVPSASSASIACHRSRTWGWWWHRSSSAI